MDQKLLRYFMSLKVDAEAAQRGASVEISEIIADIARICEDLVTEKDLSFAVSIVFDTDAGIFSIIETLMLIRDRGIQKARESCLGFLADLIKNIGIRVAPYASLVKEKCLNIFRRDDSKSVQAAALNPLISLLSMQQNDSFGFSFDWPAAEILLAEYRKAKSSGTLRSNILIVLGLAAEHFPHLFEQEHMNGILKLCLDTLGEQLHQKGKDPVYVLVVGSLKCLDSLLTWFDASVPAGGTVENARRIYSYLEQVIYYREDLKRYEMVKVGLHLISRHACLFRLLLVQDSMKVLKWLQAYCTHTNALLRDAALPAFNHFMSQVVACLTSEDHRVTNGQQTYKKLISYALDILDSQDIDSRLVSLAIRALGKLSPVIIKYSGKDSLKQTFYRLVAVGAKFTRFSEIHDDSMGFSVTLVGAFADIIVHFDDIENHTVTVIVEAIGDIFYRFPNLFPKQKLTVYKTLFQLLQAFCTKGALFSLLLSNTVWSSLEKAMEPSGEGESSFWQHYSELWLKILDLTLTQGVDSSTKKKVMDIEVEVSSSETHTSEPHIELQTFIFDALIRCSMKAMSELNLKYRVKGTTAKEKTITESSKEKGGDMAEVDSDEGLIEPLNELHMKKFLNLVEFVQQILSSHFGHLFLKWVYPFSRCLVELSSCYPLISGFYKLLTVTIKIADKENYFTLISGDTTILSTSIRFLKDEKDGEGLSFSESDRLLCKELLCSYVLEVLISSKRYKLELLASCLQLCLSAPPEIIGISHLVEPLKDALKIGLRYSPLAVVTMDSLEKWLQFRPSELEPYLPLLVPCLSNYLYESDAALLGLSDDSSVSQGQRRSSKTAKSQTSQPSSFELIQIRIQKFLGRTGRYAHCLVPDIDLLLLGTGGLAWDAIDQVKFTLPFRDEKPDIWLDPLIPRIVELAISTSDRRTKVIACEILHAVCLLMLGNAAKGPTRRNNNDAQNVHYEKIYRKLFPALIHLAADIELVTRDLFSKLIFQLIHWFTLNVQKENLETMSLLDSILEGLVDSESGSLREQCANFFEEFLRWSVKHTPPQVDNFVNVTSMLCRLYNRLDHPNPYHRLGAAMAASRIYRVLRENKPIIDRYILELLYYCIKSLCMAESDSHHIGTEKLIGRVLDDYVKLVKRNLIYLQQSKKDRSMFSSLDAFMDWLFRQTGRIEGKCRSKCISLFSSICAALPVSSPAGWFTSVQSQERIKTLKMFDMRAKFPVINENKSSVEELEQWMMHLNSSLHWFGWALRVELITLTELSMQTSTETFCIVNGIKYFLALLLKTERCQILKLLTPTELGRHECLLCESVFYLMGFLKEVLYLDLGIKEQFDIPEHLIKQQKEQNSLVSELIVLDEPKIHQFMCILLLYPQELGIGLSRNQKSVDLPRLVMKVVNLLALLSSSFRQGVILCLRELLLGKRPEFDLASVDFLLDSGSQKHLSLDDLSYLLKGYQQLLVSGLLASALGKDSVCTIGEKLLLNVYSLGRECPPALQPIASEALTLSFSMGVKGKVLLDLLFKCADVSPSNSRKLAMGTVFYLNFRRVIIQQIKFAYKDCLLVLLQSAPESDNARLLLTAILDDYIQSGSGGNKITVRSFLEEFLCHLHLLKPFCVSKASLNDKLFFLEILQKILILDSDVPCFLQPGHPSFSFIIETYVSFLCDTHDIDSVSRSSNANANFIVKSNTVVLIPYLFERLSSSPDLQCQFVGALMKLVTDYLLVQESDIPVGSNQRASYMNMLYRLLDAVSLSKTLELLEVLFPLLQNPTKLSKRKIADTLNALSESLGEKRESACDMCLAIITDNGKPPSLRRSVIELVFSPMVKAAPSESLIHWYANNTNTIVSFLGQKMSYSEGSTEEEDKLLVKINSYRILELLFCKGDASLIKDRITPLISNQQIMQMATNDSRAKNEPTTYLFPENSTLWHDLHTAAYNCLAAVVMCTQDQEKIFSILLKDFPGKPLWQHLVNCERTYDNFPIETSEVGVVGETIKSLRDERRVKRRQQGGPSSLTSQYIIGASLSQEPGFVDAFPGNEVGNFPASQESPQENNVEFSREIEMVALDDDDFDKHPCMPTILKLIGHLHAKYGNHNQHSHGMPDWMKALHSTLESAGTHTNIRLFICKVVIKARKIFGPFASLWFRPLVQTILTDPERSGGRRFHYLLRDICITLLDWGMPTPDTGAASAFLNYLISVSPHESKQVLQANLGIIKLLLARWKDLTVIDRGIIASFLNTGGKNPSFSDKLVVMRRSVGLQLLGALFSVGIPVYDDLLSSFTERDLCKTLLSNLNCKVKNLYEASAELIGMVLKERSEKDLKDEQILESPLRETLLVLFKEDMGQFLTILDRVTSRFPAFLGRYTSMIFDILPRAHGVFRITALDIILRFPHGLPNLSSLILPSLSKLLTHHDEVAQLKSLCLVSELVKGISKQNVSEQVLQALYETFSKHESSNCRQKYYEILVFLYNEKEMKDDKLLIQGLVVGLCDDSKIIRGILQSFWNVHLSKDLQQRFLEVINQIYSPSIEEHWSHCANTLLLKLCEESVDFKRSIFNAPLSDCEFKEYTFDQSLLRGTIPMTPMFSDTHGSQSQISEGNGEGRANQQAGMLRATDEYSPSITLTQIEGTYSAYTLPGMDGSFWISPEKSAVGSLKQEGSALVDTSTKLKRRIFNSNISRQQATRGVLNAIKRREVRVAEQVLERANKVQMLRRYRIGELPDIEIKSQEIIEPLVALAERDPTFSRILLRVISRAVYSLSNNMSELDLKASAAKSFEKALECSQNKISFVGCILSLCLECKDAWINPKIIGLASRKSANYHSGILFLENAILQENTPWQFSMNPSKRQKGSRGQVIQELGAIEDAWLELANLYKSIGEDDVVLSIYKNKLTKLSTTHDALEAQLSGDSARALLVYNQAIDQWDQPEGFAANSPSEFEQDLWYIQRLQCMADLLQWHNVMEEIQFQVEETGLEKLWDPKARDSYLNFFIRAASKMPTHHIMLANFIQAAIEDTEKRNFLQNEFGSQMASLAVSNDQFDRARYYIHNCYKSFRNHWTEVHPLATGARHSIIQQLQKTVELNEFIDLSADSQEKWISLIREWRRRWASTIFDGVEAWDDILQNRLLFLQKLQGIFNTSVENRSVENGKQFVSQLDEERGDFYYQAAKGLMKKGAYNVAQGYMNECIAVRGETSNKEVFKYQTYKTVVKLRCLQAGLVTRVDTSKAIQMLQQVLNYIRNLQQQEQGLQHKGLKLLLGSASSQLAWINVISRSSQGSIHECISLFGSAFQAYNDTLDEISQNTNEFSLKAIARASLKFASFCDELLSFSESREEHNAAMCDSICEGDEASSLPSSSTYPALIVRHVLRAAQLNASFESHHSIARVIALTSKCREARIQFSISVKESSSWFFVAWIPQMLAVMDKEAGEAFVSVLEDIAKQYPQTVYFPFNVSKSDFGPVGKARTQGLETILRSPPLQGFVRALQDLTFPEQRLRDGLVNMKSSMSHGNRKRVQEIFQEVFDDCLNARDMVEVTRNSGEYNLKFARDYSRKVIKAFGENGCKLASMDEKQLNQGANEIMAALQKASLHVGKMSLGSLSKWMADFNQKLSTQNELSSIDTQHFSNNAIYIPGNWVGFRKNNAYSQVELVGFDQTVTCLASKQRPKILKMRGSDEGEYKFVVKGGEDLRLDQRIEQLFEVMNSIFSRDPKCSRRKLLLSTYAVIPVSKQCGLLQFVENTCVLEDVIKDGLNVCNLPNKSRIVELLNGLKIKYREWVEKKGRSHDIKECYTNMYSRVNRSEMAEQMSAHMQGLPWDTLKTGMLRLTTSAESFIALRSQYEKSLAVLSICGYIAGVGDRHLSNILLDKRSGSLVLIDFGYSFGTGTILLPVPELVPFRLTPQLTNVLLPQDAKGLLRNDMIHAMSALHSNRRIISAVMDVFVNEPLVEWKTEAMKTSNIRKGLSHSHEEHHVELKVENAHRKLELWNPSLITISELQTSVHTGKIYMPELVDIVRGHPGFNFRARVETSICRNVEQQVDCLIDQATDPNLLGRIWIGWQPWI